MTRTPLIAGNWKMFGLQADRAEARALAEVLRRSRPACEVVLCPPTTLLADLARDLAGSPVRLGAQTCHVEPNGARTGEISPEMLADAGARFVIVGHSERRAEQGETDAVVSQKARAAVRAGLTPIVCVGETLAERESGRAETSVAAQIEGSLPDAAALRSADFVVAYEPVWAIGAGVTPDPAAITAMHTLVRAKLNERFGAAAAGVRVIYGGSVKPANAGAILSAAEVDGALVGAASLTAEAFLAVIEAGAQTVR